MDLWHHKDETLRRRGGLGVDGDGTFDLDQRRLVDERLRLRIDGMSTVRIRDGRDRAGFLGLLGVVELDVPL